MSGNYPPGVSDNTPGAPWNDEEIPYEEFNVLVSQTLSKSTTVETDNYIPGASGVDYDRDGEGGYIAIGWHDDPDTSDTDWKEAYSNDFHYTPLELIGLFKAELEKQLKTTEKQNEKNKLKHLIEECEGWTEDECEIMEE